MDAALAEHGLTAPLYAVLAMLGEHPGLSNAELARRSFVAPPTMLRMLNTLSQAGLIDRAEPTPEQRIRGNVLTTKGRQRLTASSTPVQQFEDLLVAQAEPGQLEIVMRWLHDCAEQLDGHTRL